jgi:putative peptide zinc metalloprotease protein
MDGEESYVLIGARGVPMRLSKQAYLILGGMAEGRTPEEIALALSEAGSPTTPPAVEHRAQEMLDRIAHIEANPRRPVGFWLKRQLLGPRTVARLAGPLARAFDTQLAFAVLIVAAVAGWLAYMRPREPGDAGTALWGYGIFLASLAAHELGHAAASSRMGVSPSGIGVVMYLIYPAFFSDVTETWRLPRRQRVLVDLGGLYFQSIFAALLCLVAALWSSPALTLGLALVGLSLVASLNPFIRFDGYWIFIDALGLSSTGEARSRLLRMLTARLRGETITSDWPRSTMVVVAIYMVLLPLAWIYMIITIAPFLVAQTVNYPGLVTRVGAALLEGRADPTDIQALLVGTLIALGALLLTYRVVLTLVSALYRLVEGRLRSRWA